MKRFWQNIRGLLLLLGIFMVVLALDLSGVAWYYNHVLNFIHHQAGDLNADAGVIFFGDYIERNNFIELGPDTKSRANEAITLYQQGKIKHIICVGGYHISSWSGKPHLLSNYLVQKGIPRQAITYDSLSFNTITNWAEAEKIIKRNNYHQVVAISSPLHIYRIACMVRSDGVAFACYNFNPATWDQYWVLYKDVHHEWLSQFMNFALSDETRNTLVFLYRTVSREISNLF
ncbi:MAG: YdcF family protein [Bacteroidales bacterium]|nr:YdcF family protein [Bacteroidales bacterium]